jgi:hypothetical protein
MAFRKFLILRKLPTGPRGARPEGRLRSYREGRTNADPVDRQFPYSLASGNPEMSGACPLFMPRAGSGSTSRTAGPGGPFRGSRGRRFLAFREFTALTHRRQGKRLLSPGRSRAPG